MGYSELQIRQRLEQAERSFTDLASAEQPSCGNRKILSAGFMDDKKPRINDYSGTLDTATGKMPGFRTSYVIEYE